MTKVQTEEFVEFGVAQYLQVLRRRWLPVGLTVIICTGLSAFIAARGNKPMFTAEGKLLFQSKDPKSELTGVGPDVSRLELDTVGRNNPLENQANLLVSGSLLEEVIKTLDMRTPTGDYVPFYLVQRNIKVKQIPDTDILRVSYTSADPGFSADFVDVLMKSYLKFNARNQKYNLDSARNFIKNQLPKLKADFEQASRALRDFKSRNRVISLDSKADEVATLNAETLQNERESLQKVEAASARVDALQRQLQQLKGQSSFSFSELTQLNDSDAVQKALTDLQAVEAELEIQRERYTADHPIVIDLQLKANSLRNILNSQSSVILGRQASINPRNLQLSELQKKLLSDLSLAQIELQTVREEAQLLRLKKSSLDERVTSFADLEKTQKDLEQTLESSRKRYFQLLESLEKLDLTEVKIRESSQVQIIESAINYGGAASGFNYKIVIAGALLGMSLAFGLALLLDILDSKIKTVDQLQSLLKYPILGIIPKHDFSDESEEIIDFSGSENSMPHSRRILSFVGEDFAPIYHAYQQIFINLTLLGQEHIPRTISVTSSLHREGKSEIAANLAATLAQSGHQTLLVDASVRNPSQHKLWKLENNVGLSDILYDSVNVSLVRQKVAPNLYVITSGPTISNMSVISRYSEFLAFVAHASEQYDCVVFDSGPMLAEPDAISLCRACEGTILVASLKQLQAGELVNMRSLVQKANIPVLGVVVNKAEGRDIKKGYRFFSTPSGSVLPEKTEAAKVEFDVINS